MNEAKSLLLSKTFWGIVLTVVGFFAKDYANALDPDSIVSMFDAVLVAVGAVLAVYGRIKAVKSVKVL